LSERLRAAWLRSLAAAQGRLELSARALQGVSPLATLHRGFAILTRGSDGTIIRQRAQLTIGDPIEARVADGVITALVTGTRES
jgi:exodeoxyribonuclease VII large subunit